MKLTIIIDWPKEVMERHRLTAERIHAAAAEIEADVRDGALLEGGTFEISVTD